MPKTRRDPLFSLCRRRVAAVPRLAPDERVRLADRVYRLLKANRASGRLDRLACGRPEGKPLSTSEYIDRLLLYIQQEGDRVDRLANGDTDEWARLSDLLTRRAVKLVLRFRSGPPLEEAMNFAQEACRTLFEKRYPFDVSFDAWAMTILKNLIVEHYTRSGELMNRTVTVSLEGSSAEQAAPLDLLPDARSTIPFEQAEDRTMLLKAIDRLGDAQRLVIQESYLHGMDDAAIARKLGKTRQAVYNLRNRALARLRQLLTEMGAQESGPPKH